MTGSPGVLGLGVGWRPELASPILRRPDLGFVEIVAEAFPPDRPLPLALRELLRRGVAVVPHGVRLSLGGAQRPDPVRLAALAALAERVAAPLVSEHVAFVRGGGVEAGHLLPIPRTRAALDVLVENVRVAMDGLPVPLALEPIAALFEWPDAELDEASFLAELLDRTSAHLLLDVANLYANARNAGLRGPNDVDGPDPLALLDGLPLDRIAYVHVAGGVEEDGVYHDSHAHPVPAGVLDLLAELARCRPVPAVMLERDRRFPTPTELNGELDAIRRAAGLDGSGTPAAVPVAQRRAPAVSRPADAAVRARLGEQQAGLVASLLRTAPPPERFDPHRLEAAATALAEKRSRAERSREAVPTGSRGRP